MPSLEFDNDAKSYRIRFRSRHCSLTLGSKLTHSTAELGPASDANPRVWNLPPVRKRGSAQRNGGTEPRYGFFTPIRHRTFSPVAEKSYLRCPLFFGYLRFAAFGVLPGSRGFSESIFAGRLDIHCSSM